MFSEKNFAIFVLLLLIPGIALASIILQWQAPTQNSDGTPLTDLAGYNVYRTITPGTNYSKINPSLVASTTYQDAATTTGQRYCYVLTTVNTSGTQSDYSSEACGTDEETIKFCTKDIDCPTGYACQNNRCVLLTCGNGTIDSGEDCDGTNLNSQTCSSQGFSSGSLSCSASCQFDTSSCIDGTDLPKAPINVGTIVMEK